MVRVSVSARIQKESQSFSTKCNSFESGFAQGNSHAGFGLATLRDAPQRNYLTCEMKHCSIQQHKQAEQRWLGFGKSSPEFLPGKIWRMQSDSQPSSGN